MSREEQRSIVAHKIMDLIAEHDLPIEDVLIMTAHLSAAMLLSTREVAPNSLDIKELVRAFAGDMIGAMNGLMEKGL